MGDEELKPRPPFYAKDGTIRDLAIARAMAVAQDRIREENKQGGFQEGNRMYRSPELVAEMEGEIAHRRGGVEIAASEVPESVRKNLERLMGDWRKKHRTPYDMVLGTEKRHYRKQERDGDGSKAVYMLVCSWQSSRGDWMWETYSEDSTGKHHGIGPAGVGQYIE